LASLSAAAAHVFLSTTRFKEMVDIGAITRQAPGKYDLDVVRRETFAHLRAERGGHGTAALSTERAALAREQTLTAQIKNAAARGDLVSLAAMQKRLVAVLVKLPSPSTSGGFRPLGAGSGTSQRSPTLLRVRRSSKPYASGIVVRFYRRELFG